MNNKRIVDISLIPFRYNRFLSKDILHQYTYYTKLNNIDLVQLNKYNYLKETHETDDILFLNIMDSKGKLICKNNNLKTKEMEDNYDYLLTKQSFQVENYEVFYLETTLLSFINFCLL